MKKIGFIIFLLFAIFIVYSNINAPYINLREEGLFKSYLFQTENGEFAFWAIPSKGSDLEMMEGQFSVFKEENPEYNNLKIFRTFKRDPLKYWNWFDYLTNDRYDYPYKEKVEK